MLSFHAQKVFGNLASCNYCAKPNAENLLYAEVQPIVYKFGKIYEILTCSSSS